MPLAPRTARLALRRFRRAPLCGLLLALVLCQAPAALGQGSPRASAPVTVGGQADPAQGPQVAATGPERLAVGWSAPGDAVSTGAVLLRWRLNFLMSSEQRIPARSPRDLALAFDTQGRLHAAWTALDGDQRRLFHLRADSPEAAPSITPVTAGLDGDSDFPALEPAPDGGMILAWQQAQGLRFGIHAALVTADGGLQPLGPVSGDERSGLNPQILSADPIRIAWHRIGEIAESVHVDQWHPNEQRWRPSAAERLARLFDDFGQVRLQPVADDAVVAAWPERDADGNSLLALGRADAQALLEAPALDIDLIDRPAGQHAAPSLSWDAAGRRVTAAWQVFVGTHQAVCIVPAFSGDAGDAALSPLILSSSDQRFASEPDHVSRADWSAATWIDDARDGGSGHVYLAEVQWPARTGASPAAE